HRVEYLDASCTLSMQGRARFRMDCNWRLPEERWERNQIHLILRVPPDHKTLRRRPQRPPSHWTAKVFPSAWAGSGAAAAGAPAPFVVARHVFAPTAESVADASAPVAFFWLRLLSVAPFVDSSDPVSAGAFCVPSP